ncbi:MAG: hypothetical protein ABSF70_18125 [Terracidiphilus sp.]|jgi:hypothetical protein
MPAKRYHGAILFAVVIVTILSLNILQILFVRDFGWDDGSIIVAYSRTFAESGRIALTPISEQVEGSSSPSWFFILAGCYRVLHPGFLAMLQIGQVLAACCSALACGMLYVLIHRRIGSLLAMLASFSLGLCSMFLYESANGMEMGLLSFLVALCIFAVQRKYPVLLIVATMFATTVRFEAAFYLFLAGLAIFLAGNRQSRKLGVQIVVSTILAWTGVELWRLFIFHSIMPNTIYAKRWFPYSRHGLAAVISHLSGLFELYVCLFVLILGAGWLYITRNTVIHNPDESTGSEQASLLSADAIRFCFGYTIGVTIFSFITGTNWGYYGRMQLSCFIPAILILLYFAQYHRQRLGVASTSVVLVLWWASTFAVNYRKVDFHVAWYLALREHDAVSVSDASHNLLKMQRWFPYHYAKNWYGVTPRNYAITGRTVDDIREQLNLPRISFMTPDVGGISLCCERIRIVDSASLTNAILAHNGYSAMARVLSEENPELIETHGVWAQAANMYELPKFIDHYSPAIYENDFLWIRNDILYRLKQAQPSIEVSVFDALSQNARYLSDDSEASKYDYPHLRLLNRTVTLFKPKEVTHPESRTEDRGSLSNPPQSRDVTRIGTKASAIN